MLQQEISMDAEVAELIVGDYHWDLLIGHLNPLEQNCPDNGVSGLQGRLAALGYNVGPIDGILGQRTRSALSAFQFAQGLQGTGQLDQATRDKLGQVFGF
jgi:peptidoglycan hydrolase-like protein with peptidoglycan-binding domain